MRYEDCVKVKLDLDLYNNQQLSSKMKLSPTINHDNTLELPRPWHDFHDLLLFLLDSFTFVGRHDIEWGLTVYSSIPYAYSEVPNNYASNKCRIIASSGILAAIK